MKTGAGFVSCVVAAALGGTAVAGAAPYEAWPLMLFAYAGLFVLVDRSGPGRAAWVGAAFGIGLHTAGHGWIYGALHDKTGLSLALAALGASVCIVYLALYTASACAAYAYIARSDWHRLRAGPAWRDAGLFASLLVLGEWARSVPFNGFTSLSAGYGLIDTPLAGYAPVLGLYGVSWMGYAVAAGVAAMLARRTTIRWTDRLATGLALGIAVLAGLALTRVEWTQAHGLPLSYRLIQANVVQSEKFDPRYLQRHTERLLARIQESAADLVVTPETAFAVFLNELPSDALPALKQFSRHSHSHLLLGIATLAADSDGHNSVLHITPDAHGAPLAQYDKVRLMPFGEYSPVGFGWFTQGLSIPLKDLSAGAPDQAPFVVTRAADEQRIGTLICHEDLVGRDAAARAPDVHLFINPSNLAWFERSLAIPQRLQIARMRALEVGRPVLRTANTGVTAHIDAHGRVVERLPQERDAVLAGVVQPTQGRTPYTRFRDAAVIGLCLIVVGLSFLTRRRVHSPTH